MRIRTSHIHLMALAALFAAALALPIISWAEIPDVGSNIPTAEVISPSINITGTLTATTDVRDVYKVWLYARKEYGAEITSATAGSNIDLLLFSSTATNVVTSRPIAYDAREGSKELVWFDVRKSGWYYLDVYNGASETSVTGPVSYRLHAAQYPVPYALTSFRVPTKARKNSWFTVSIQLGPTYLGTGKPITFVAQKIVGTVWKHTMTVSVSGKNLASGVTKFSQRAKLASGTWRVRAIFKDVDHAATKTAWKLVKVK